MFDCSPDRNSRTVWTIALALISALTVNSQLKRPEASLPPDLLAALHKDLPDRLGQTEIACFQRNGIPFDKQFFFQMLVKSAEPPSAIRVSPFGGPCWPSTSNTTMWIYAKLKRGGTWSRVLETGGAEMVPLPFKNKGLPDVQVTGHMSAVEVYEDTFRFIGPDYKSIGCKTLTFRDMATGVEFSPPRKGPC